MNPPLSPSGFTTDAMKSSPRLLASAVGILLALPVAAQVVQTYSAMPNLTIPDNSTVGVAQTITLPANVVSITDVTLDLTVTGGFTGDYYAYLEHGSDVAVLLNRVGRTGSAPFGYLDNGLQVTLSDSAANGDIHTYQTVSNPAGGTLTGTWAPDGRSVSPFDVVTGDSRTATLSGLNGQSSGGAWTLYIADLSTGGVGTLANWSLTITGSSVPEPANWAWVTGTGLAILAGTRAVRRKRQ